MRQNRHVPAHRVIDHHLAAGVVEVVIAADHMGHAHIVIVDHNSQHIDGRAVRAQQDHVVKLVIDHGHVALHRRRARLSSLARRFDADHIGRVRVVRIAHRAKASGKAWRSFPRGPSRGRLRFLLGWQSIYRRCRRQHLHAPLRRGAQRCRTG